MTFTTRKNTETPADEVARLAAYPVGSTFHELSEMPVTMPLIKTGMLIRLPASHAPVGETIIVTPLESFHYEQPTEGQRLIHHRTWRCRVVGGTSKVYAPGCWDIDQHESILIRGEVIHIP